MKSRHIQTLAMVSIALIGAAQAMAQGREPTAFELEMRSVNRTWQRACSFTQGWKDEGAVCRQWLDAITQAENRPHTTAADKRAATAQRLFARRIYADGLLHIKKPQRALEEYNQAFSELTALVNAGNPDALVGGYEILTGLARAQQETGDIATSDRMHRLARSLVLKVRQHLEEQPDQLSPAYRSRVIQILMASEESEQRWAAQLSERAAHRALAGDNAAANALWRDAAQAYGQAASNLALAVASLPPRDEWPLQTHPTIRVGALHQMAGDQWLLGHAVVPAADSLRRARESHEQSQAHIGKAQAQLTKSQPYLGPAGKPLQASRLGLAEVLVHEGRMADAVALLQTVQTALAPITRREMAALAEQGKADERWRWKTPELSSTECETDTQFADGRSFCKDLAPALAQAASARVLDERLPRFHEKDLDALRLNARFLTARARWMGGNWQEAEAAWARLRAAVAADDYDRKLPMSANDDFQRLQLKRWADAPANTRR